MKRLFLFVAVIFAAIGCQNSGKSFTISGEFEGEDQQTSIVLKRGSNIEGEVIDSVQLDSNGRFEIRGRVSTPYTAQIHKLKKGGVSSGCIVFIEGGQVKITADTNGNIEASNTPLNGKYKLLTKEFEQFYSKNMNVADLRRRLDNSRQFVGSKIDENLDNPIGLFLLATAAMEELHVSTEYATNKLAEFSQEMVTSLEAADILDIIEHNSILDLGKPFIDLTLTNTRGEEISISSVTGEGKWVLINFWVTWGEPCQREEPYLREVYEKYHADGLEIFAISVDEDAEAWRAACKDLPWINTLEMGSGATVTYQVAGIPANFLISPEGKIAAKNLRNTNLLKVMGNIFKK
ncbi:MAG: TlpA disulfide reductase family protein [Rikenellaceae bacterium]